MNEFEQTAENNLRVANRDLQTTREIHQRGEEIRKRASEQLLRVEGQTHTHINKSHCKSFFLCSVVKQKAVY